ncbi:hypothetical protein BAUCODRAFT_276080 [Baudoinia panamericana UAMH 10762]|uniref:Uncharacterized protein n=1 Tax=Baudoinia panamericana (strain UAMH 10762) TaxID=717646 RepID=M2LDN1_BAUPA|nr:uncharacterized protein BAUCODRAFT_276080 [Baudoinia panamericana UAMH 10762]EMC92097.1 hypothetical protein BAUCODRAFT_276080 [Baudoinia panamericana UAMH 10762]
MICRAESRDQGREGCVNNKSKLDRRRIGGRRASKRRKVQVLRSIKEQNLAAESDHSPLHASRISMCNISPGLLQGRHAYRTQKGAERVGLPCASTVIINADQDAWL